MTFRLRTLYLPAALGATLVLASCGSSGDSGHSTPEMAGTMSRTPAAGGIATAGGRPATGVKRAADVAFVTGMIPHHAQAVQMADLALKGVAGFEVEALARKVRAAQGPEIAQMSGWLKGWGAPVPASSGGHEMSGMSDTEGMGGMLSAQQMADLGQAKGSAFDRMWLQMMTKHHQGAVALARTELTQGTNPDARQLARSVIASQSGEISQMKVILGTASVRG